MMQRFFIFLELCTMCLLRSSATVVHGGTMRAEMATSKLSEQHVRPRSRSIAQKTAPQDALPARKSTFLRRERQRDWRSQRQHSSHKTTKAKHNAAIKAEKTDLTTKIALDDDVVAVGEMRAFLGFTRTPCTTSVAEAGDLSLTLSESMGRCRQHGLTDDVCAYVLTLLGDRPWKKDKIVEACSILGDPEAVSANLREEGVVEAPRFERLRGMLLERGGVDVSDGSAHAVWHTAMDTSTIPKARLQKPQAECASEQVDRGTFQTVLACADVVKAWGGRFFTYGNAERKGECIQENTASHFCPEGWQATSNLDFYSVDELEQTGSCQRPDSWCTAPNSYFEVKDCDGDEIPDPVCYGPSPGQSGYLSSKRGCEDSSPSGGCNARKFVSGDSAQCLTLEGSDVFIADCEEFLSRQQWFFVGEYFMNKDSAYCLTLIPEDDILSMRSCQSVPSSKWYLDSSKRMLSRWDNQCLTRDPEHNGVSMQPCKNGATQRFYFTPAKHCKWSEWGAWRPCSASCDTGSTTRYRFVAQTAEKGGIQCNGEPSEEKLCQSSTRCPIHCTFAQWMEWSACSQSCNSGLKMRTRGVLDWPMYGGKDCSGVKKQQLVCNALPCPDDCKWGSWGRYQSCSSPCGGGLRTRTRHIELHAKAGGKDCPCCGEEIISCNTHPCPIDCAWGAWGAWSDCSHTCGGGTTNRERSIGRQPTNGGLPCHGSFTDMLKCSMEYCPIDCVWESWSDWSSCPGSCGESMHSKTRARGRSEPQYGGNPCRGVLEERIYCNSRECPIDCVWGEWDAWSPCFRGVYDGWRGCYKRRLRALKVDSEFGGQACLGGDHQTEVCKVCEKTDLTQPQLHKLRKQAKAQEETRKKHMTEPQIPMLRKLLR